MASLPTVTARPAPDWFEENLARIVGLPPGGAAGIPAPAGGVSDPAALRRFASALDRRLVRRLDPDTRQVRFETVGAPLIPLADAEADPLIVRATRCYIGAARDAIGSIETGLCLPDICPGEIGQLTGEIRATFDRLDAAAPFESGRVQVRMYLRELSTGRGGLLPTLRALFQGEATTIAHQHAKGAIDLAIDAVTQFAKEFKARTGDTAGSPTDFAANVRCAAETVPAFFEALGQALGQAGATHCELARIDIKGETGDSGVSVADLTRMIPTECARWHELLAGQRYGAPATVRAGAKAVQAILNDVEASAITDALQLDERAATIVEASIVRCLSHATQALKGILREPPGAPPPPLSDQQRSVLEDEAAAEIPAPDTKPLTPPAGPPAPPKTPRA